MKVYNKLVRDRIPEIIESDGKKCVTHILSDEEYLSALDKKLNEEITRNGTQIFKGLDVLEVLQAICIAKGYSLKDLETVRLKKAKERGRFENKIFLEYVE